MPWWTFGLGHRKPQIPVQALQEAYQRAFTAAAVPVTGPSTSLLSTPGTWQNEAWGYFDNLGEFNYAVNWKANMLSRVRLFAAEIVPDQDEPVRLESGPAVDLMNKLTPHGALGQSQLMSSLSVQLDVPGEGYLIGETVGGIERWSVRSIDEVRSTRGRFEVMRDDVPSNTQEWRPLSSDALIVRVYRPHKRWSSIADSSARSARGTMREIELVNRHILAQYLSRLASAGVVLFPDEITFPVREEFAEANDPFMAEWVEIAATAIREPGTASAVVPIPIRVPGEFVDKIKHLDFTLKIDDSIIEKRESAIRRLATQVNIPKEVLLGMGDVNHWGAWQIEEGALKTTISPDAELIAQSLTTGYLQPRLMAAGEDAARFVVWYDMSELTIRPDRSANAQVAYDRLELSGEALRREGGFDESDKPTPEEVREQSLKWITLNNAAASLTALSQLTGDDLVVPEPAEEIARSEPEPVTEDRDLPGTQSEPPPPPGPDLSVQRTERLIRQSKAVHAIRFSLGRRWELLHPGLCEQHAYSCPFTHAALAMKTSAHPARSGLYECRLDAFGILRIGDLTPYKDVTQFLVTNGSKNDHSS